MAKQKKTLPARKAPARYNGEESLSLRSAETLGRVIGTLQRQLDSAIERFGQSTPHDTRHPSRTSDGPARPQRREAKRVRLEPAEEVASIGRASKLGTKARRTRTTSTRPTPVKRASRPK
jgi:hypothetical protein